jgi:hypothetical protein
MKKFFLALAVFLIPMLCFASETVIVGDSLTCGPFGTYLMREVAKSSASPVTVYCTVSSAPVHWVRGKNPPHQECQTMTSVKPQKVACQGTGEIPSFAKILAAHKGANFIIALGTNSLWSPKVDANYRSMVNAMKANGSSCEWIGPPHINFTQPKGFSQSLRHKMEGNLNSFYTSLGEATEGICPLIDSRDATLAGTPGNDTFDGVHRTDSAGKYWVDQITPSLRGSSVSPLSTGANAGVR